MAISIFLQAEPKAVKTTKSRAKMRAFFLAIFIVHEGCGEVKCFRLNNY